MGYEYLGLCVSVKCGQKHVWVKLSEMVEIIIIHVGDTENFDSASRPMTKAVCESIWPGIWTAAKDKVLAETEIDDGAEC